MAIRESANELTPEKREQFVNAVVKFKTEGNPKTGRNYDSYVSWHLASIFSIETLTNGTSGFWSYSHGTPAFLPWHRVFLYLFEKDLQDVSNNPDLALPYWDISANDAATSIWTEDFLGGSGSPNNDYIVENGAFAYSSGNWPLRVRNLFVEKDDKLRRALGVGVQGSFPSVERVREILNLTPYDLAPYDETNPNNQNVFRRQMEGGAIHGIGHNWVGGSREVNGENETIGSMANVWTSTNDPVFFLHHCNIDRLWDKWQRLHGLEYHPQTPVDGLPSGSLNEAMSFGDRIRDTFSLNSFGYEYDGLASDDTEPETEAFSLTADELPSPGEYKNGRYPE
ncbi:MAG: tyrosinase family protein [Methylococcaceae bacterium]